MDEREVLELAALAAGYVLTWKTGHCKGGEFHGAFISGKDDAWNPRTDDGDALRLAVKVDLNVFQTFGSAYAMPSDDSGEFEQQVRYIDADDCYAATRLAIVRAAAAIGQQMKEQT